MGLGANWASCVKECRGKYICNCDNDDYWHNPNKLQLQLDYMETHPMSNILITNHRTHNRTTGEILEHQAQIDHSDIQQSMWGGCSFCNATIMYRADFMKAHLDLDEFIRRRLSLQDWPAWVVLTAYTDIDEYFKYLKAENKNNVKVNIFLKPKSINTPRNMYNTTYYPYYTNYDIIIKR